jgi:hypothetical protein
MDNVLKRGRVARLVALHSSERKQWLRHILIQLEVFQAPPLEGVASDPSALPNPTLAKA